jgi:hypothetical protein
MFHQKWRRPGAQCWHDCLRRGWRLGWLRGRSSSRGTHCWRVGLPDVSLDVEGMRDGLAEVGLFVGLTCLRDGLADVGLTEEGLADVGLKVRLFVGLAEEGLSD